MSITLSQLQAATGYGDIAPIFSLTPARLAAMLYGPGVGYKTFTLPKKSGGVRLIDAPTRVRRELQRSLKTVFDAVYRRPEPVHGFVVGRSVKSNAAVHVGRKTVVNIDLEDFFPTISFQRVRGLLLAHPFGLKWPVANIIAQIVCCNGRLPAGGVTSPVLSNLVLSRFDKSLATVVGRFGGRYTRYADDLTLSFDRGPEQLHEFIQATDPGGWAVGPTLNRLVLDAGFVVNGAKLRVRTGSSRKTVTGVVVNARTNPPRSWLQKLEKDVYLAGKFGVGSLAKIVYPSETEDVASSRLYREIHGRLAYLSMIRGRTDWVSAGLASSFNAIIGPVKLRVPDVEKITQPGRAPRSVYVVTGHDSSIDLNCPDVQGTAFVANRGLIYTAAHVVDGSKKEYVIHHPKNPKDIRKCLVLHVDNHRDVAVMKLASDDHDLTRVRFSIAAAFDRTAEFRSIGFPDYRYGQKHHFQNHHISASTVVSLVNKHVITGAVRGGLSGAPLINSRCEVVGLVHKGFGQGWHQNEIICSQMILRALESM